MARGRKIDVTIGFDADQLEALDRLAEQLRTKRPTLVRQAVDIFLARNIPDWDTPVENKDAA